MDIISFVKKHKLYKYVKENNGLIIFLLTISGTALTFMVRGIGYLYYYAKYKTLNIPSELITNEISSVSLTITIISIFLGVFSSIVAILFEMSLTELRNDSEKKLSEKIAIGVCTVIFYTIILLPTNYTFLLLQRFSFDSISNYILCVILSIYEVVLMHFISKEMDKKEGKKNSFVSIFFSFLMVVVLIACIYNSGISSATSASNAKQILSIEQTEYIVLEKYDDKFILAECEENDNTLTIHTDKQKVINYENVEYENKKFNSIKLEGNK